MKNNKDNKQTPNITTNLSGIQQALSDAKAPNIIHHRGDLNSVTFEGKKFSRVKSIFMRDYGFVPCAPYDDHFLLYDPSHLGWTTFCTCGAPAVIVGYDAYKQDASPEGLLMVCLQHAQTGKHMPVNKR